MPLRHFRTLWSLAVKCSLYKTLQNCRTYPVLRPVLMVLGVASHTTVLCAHACFQLIGIAGSLKVQSRKIEYQQLARQQRIARTRSMNSAADITCHEKHEAFLPNSPQHSTHDQTVESVKALLSVQNQQELEGCAFKITLKDETI